MVSLTDSGHDRDGRGRPREDGESGRVVPELDTVVPRLMRGGRRLDQLHDEKRINCTPRRRLVALPCKACEDVPMKRILS